MDHLLSETFWPVMFAFFMAAFVKGVTGLGFSTTCLAILTVFIGLKDALPLVLVPSLFSNIIVMRAAGYFKQTVRSYWPLYLAAIPGIFIGLTVLVWINQTLAAACLGSVLIVYGLFALLTPSIHIPVHFQRPLNPVIGLLTGIVNGLTGSQVMPILPYMMSLGLDKKRFTQAINCNFSLSSLMMGVGLAHYEMLTLTTLVLSAMGLLPIYAGVKIGTLCQGILSEKVFRGMVLLVLIILGFGLMIRPVLEHIGSV